MKRYDYDRLRVALTGEQHAAYKTEHIELKPAMWQIQEYLVACYRIGINPLPGLRRILPSYEWEHRKHKDQDVMWDCIARADLIWRVDWVYDFNPAIADSFELVTATRSGFRGWEKLPPNWFWVPKGLDQEDTGKREEWVRGPLNAKPIMYEVSSVGA